MSITPLVLRVREWREKRGLTQAQLAEQAGVRQATISSMETGQSRRVDFDTIEAIARALKIKATDLIGETRRSSRGDGLNNQFAPNETAPREPKSRGASRISPGQAAGHVRLQVARTSTGWSTPLEVGGPLGGHERTVRCHQLRKT